MAERTQERTKLAELVRRSGTARIQIGLAHANLRRRLDIPERLKESIKSQPMKWLGGSMLAGLFGSFIFKGGIRKKESISRAGGLGNFLTSGLLKLLYKLVKPAAQIYATKLLKDYLEARLIKGSSPSGNRQNTRHVDNP